jgi:tRNA A37 threonylcarbamoyladenosine dehydratase
MRFERTYRLYGPTAFAALAAARVAVVGIGGVGSYAVEALARSGIGALLLIDDDVVEPSNMNRQLWALESTLGAAKVEVARARVSEINPACVVDVLQRRVTAESVGVLLHGRLDAVIDAIDRVDDKVALLAHCVQRSVAVIACMGAARRRDPTQVRYGAIDNAGGCPLARAVRRGLRAAGAGVNVPVVYSTERPRDIAGGERLPSACAVPAGFGMAAAAWVCEHLVRAAGTD